MKDNEDFSCDWKPHTSKQISSADAGNQSAFYQFHRNCEHYSWIGIIKEAYKKEKGNFAHIVRNNIIGEHGESCLFNLRYFEISQGGYSTLERHQHEHVVICVRGKGKILLGETTFELNFLDTVYISPHTPHQLINENQEPFGFLCIVNKERDKPVIL